MNLKPIDKMVDQEFETILDQISENDPDMISLSDFMETLWAIRSKKYILWKELELSSCQSDPIFVK